MKIEQIVTAGADQLLVFAALEYAERGWKIVPCRPSGKIPLTPNGYKDASSDPAQITEWWSKWPLANIGLACDASGVVVVDADTYKPECEWANMARSLDVPDTLIQRSASGGTHYFFSAPEDAEFKGQMGKGIDVKHKGYVLLEPSVFGGNKYQFQTDDDLAPVPDWVPRKETPADCDISDLIPDATPEEIQWVIDRLKTAENTLDRDAWVQLALAVKGVCGEAARGAFIEFSYRWPDTKQGDPEREWDTAKPNGSLTLGTIKHYLGSEGAPKSDDMDLSEDALALGLGRSGWDADAKFVSNWGKWLFWDGSRWVVDERKKAFTDIRAYLRRKSQSLMDWAEEKGATVPEPEKLMRWAEKEAKSLRANGKVTAIEALARSNPKSAALAEEFDAALMLTGTPQGTVDLERAELRSAKREDMLTKSTSVSPAPAGAKPQLWLEFLDTIFDGDQEVIGFMQRLCGYALTGRTDEQKLFFLHGSGANGKSVFLNTLVWLFGDYAKRAPSDTFLMTRGEQHPTNLAGLHGARLVVGSELPKGKTWNDSVIKDLTGGDRIAARYMRQDFFEFDPQLTLMIAGNTKPSFGAVDNAMKRRVVLIPFDVTIPPEKRDGKLEEKLRNEGPEILRWCMEGAAEWDMFGLAIPEVIRAASETYLEGEDELGQFLEECTVADVSGFVSNSDLWERYSGWCLLELTTPMGKNNFLKAIEERGFKAKKGTGGTRGKSGLRLK